MGIAILAVLGTGALSCQPEEQQAGGTVSFEKDVQPIFEMYCTLGCHVPMGYAEFMLLGESYGPEHIVNVRSTEAPLDVIEPGSLEGSYMWHKLNGTHLDVGGSGDAMPFIDFPLAEEHMSKIEEWILSLE